MCRRLRQQLGRIQQAALAVVFLSCAVPAYGQKAIYNATYEGSNNGKNPRLYIRSSCKLLCCSLLRRMSTSICRFSTGAFVGNAGCEGPCPVANSRSSSVSARNGVNGFEVWKPLTRVIGLCVSSVIVCCGLQWVAMVPLLVPCIQQCMPVQV